MPKDVSFESELLTKSGIFTTAPDLTSKFTGLCGGCNTRFLDDAPVRNAQMYVETLKSPELRQAEARHAALFAGGRDLGVFADPTIGEP